MTAEGERPSLTDRFDLSHAALHRAGWGDPL